MSYPSYTPHQTMSYPLVSVPKATLAMGGLGVIIGGSAAAAKSIRRVQTEAVDREQAVKEMAMEAAGTGLATAAGTAVVGTLGIRNGLFSVLGMLTVATGVKYAWDRLAAARTETAAVLATTEDTEKDSKTKKS